MVVPVPRAVIFERYLACYCVLMGVIVTNIYSKTTFQKEMVHWVPMVEYLTLTILNGDWPRFILISVSAHAYMYMYIFFSDFHESTDPCGIVFSHIHPKRWKKCRYYVRNRLNTYGIYPYTVQNVSFRLWYDPIRGISNLGIYNFIHFISYGFTIFVIQAADSPNNHSTLIPTPTTTTTKFEFESLWHR